MSWRRSSGLMIIERLGGIMCYLSRIIEEAVKTWVTKGE